MFQFSFKNRIAFYYLITTALMVSIVFVIIYATVSFTIYNHIDKDLAVEVTNYRNEMGVSGGNICFQDARRWKQKDHITLSVNPVFAEILDGHEKLVDKSPNLKESDLKFYPEKKEFEQFDTRLNGIDVRQIQFSIRDHGKVAGYMIIAISLEESNMVLHNLGEILAILFPVILVVLFLAARFIAGKSIKPIIHITETSSIITRENLKSRIALPANKDELYVLSETINNLLDRIENTISREKEFTSDASHELRTPLAVIKGTLEVLIRKPRNQKEYEDKINFCISEVNRLNHMVDQLLMLARFENQNQTLKIEKVYLNSIILDTVSRYSEKIQLRNIRISTLFSDDFYVNSDHYLLAIIFDNLISNALKYSNDDSELIMAISTIDSKTVCRIQDSGIGIPTEDLQKIFDQFYRSKSTEHSGIKGTGLGLSIVKRLSTLLHIDVVIESIEDSGTTVMLRFQ